MATTINNAFSEFMKDKVNLDSNDTKIARSNRDWLTNQIHKFDDEEEFPTLYNDKDIFFGSFARITKIRELDDIDMMIALNAKGSIYSELSNIIEITVPATADNLLALCHDNTNQLNYRKVINKFVTSLKDVPQYEKAQINRN